MTSTLLSMLQYRRPHGSPTEKKFIARYLDSVPGMRADRAGNRYIAVGSEPSTLISCHVDTVHSEGGLQNVRSHRGVISLAPSRAPKSPRYGTRFSSTVRRRTCLGADDAAGMYAALRMIERKVRALYVFHRGEECGGIGSRWIRDYNPDLLGGIKRAIAIDRRGQADIITHQMMGRCCSDDFAWELAWALDMNHSPCAFGSFTDTAHYTELVPECTNVSAGYVLEHTGRESLDSDYLHELIERLCSVDFDRLPVVRSVDECEDYRYGSVRYGDCQYGSVRDVRKRTYGVPRAYLDRLIDECADSDIEDYQCAECHAWNDHYSWCSRRRAWWQSEYGG